MDQSAQSAIIALASDQGATISVDGGATWSSWYNQPTAQMYHVNADNRFPYWVCGGQQESGSACVISRGNWGRITERDWHTVGAQEYGYVVPDPLHPGITFGGKVEKHDERTDQTQAGLADRVAVKVSHVVRTEPLAFDHFDQHRLYFGANVVFATENGGQSWRVISPDLTRAHPGVPPVLGDFDRRRSAKRQAPRRRLCDRTFLRALGNDLGRHRRRAGLDHACFDRLGTGALEQHHAAGTDAVEQGLADRRLALRRRYRFRRGQSLSLERSASVRLRYARRRRALGSSNVGASRSNRSTPCAKIPIVRDLLYAATENGVYVSFDGGARWQSLQNESAAHVGARSDRARQRPHRRHARPRLLDSR